jgi:hypothetical protein
MVLGSGWWARQAFRRNQCTLLQPARSSNKEKGWIVTAWDEKGD